MSQDSYRTDHILIYEALGIIHASTAQGQSIGLDENLKVLTYVGVSETSK